MTRIIPPQSVTEYFSNHSKRTKLKYLQLSSAPVLPLTNQSRIELVLTHANQLEINLSTLDLKTKNNSYNLYFREKNIGKLLLNDGLHISLNNPDHTVKITGTLVVATCIIKSSGEIIVDSSIKATKLLRINSRQLTVSQPIVDCEQVFLQAEEKTVIEAGIYSQNCGIIAPNLILAANIHTQILKVQAHNHLEIKKKVRGAFSATVEARTVLITGSISGDQISIHAHQKIEHTGSMTATENLDISAPEFNDTGKLQSRGTLKIKSEATTLAKTAVIESGIEFRFTGAKLDSSGNFKLTGAAFFSVGNFTHAGNFNFPAEVYLHAQNLVVNSGNFGWFATDLQQPSSYYGKPLIRVIQVDLGANFASDTMVGIQASQFLTPQLHVYGNFNIDFAFVKAKNILVAKQTTIKNSGIQVEEKITTIAGSKVVVTKSVLQSNKLSTEAKSELSTNDSKLFANFIQIDSPTKLSNTTLAGKYITYGGQSRMNEGTRVIASKVFRVQVKSKVHFDNSRLQTPDAFIVGDCMAENETSLSTDNLDISGELSLIASGIRAKKIYSHANAKMRGERALWMSDSCLINGQSQFTGDKFEVKHFSNTGQVVVKNSHIMSENAVLSSGNFEIDTATLKTDQLNFSGTYKIIGSGIQAMHIDSTASGALISSKLKATFLDLEEKSRTQIQKSQVDIEHTDAKSDLSMQQTQMSAHTFFHSQGQCTVSDKSGLYVRDALVTDIKSTFVLDSKSLINGENEKANNFSLGYFGGSVDTDDAYILLHQVSFAGNRLNMQQTGIEVRQHLNLLSTQQNLKHVSVTANNVMIAGNVKMHDKTQIKADALQVLPHTKVDADKVKIEIKNGIDIHGDFTTQQSEMYAHHLNVYKQLKLQQSKVVVEDKFEAFVPSTLSSTESVITANDLKIYGTADAKKSKLEANNTLTVAYGGHLKTDEVELDAKKSMFVSASSRVDGRKLHIKSDTLDNAGTIEVDGLNIDVDVLNNCNGYINGGSALQINANMALFNILGGITATNTAINAGLSLNYLGDICGSDNLSLNSLVNLNLLGSHRGYNANINSLFSLNYGLVLPALPSSTDAIFSAQHLLSFSRMALTNIFPSASNTINLSFQLAPMVWSLGSKIYTIANSKDKNWEDLLPIKGNPANWTLAKDIIPAVLSIKNLIVTSSNLFSTVHGMQSEWQTFTWDKVQQDFSNLSAESFVGFAATAIGPTLTQASVINFNGGLNTSLNVTQSDWLSFNSGIDLGFQSLMHNTHTMRNHGLIVGAQTNLTGNEFTNYGEVVGLNRMYMRFDSMGNEIGGQVYGSHANVEVNQLRNQGDMKFDESSRLDIDYFNNGVNGNFSLAGNSRLESNHFTEADTSFIQDSYLLVRKELIVDKTGDIAVHNSISHIGNLTVAGKAAFRRDLPSTADAPTNPVTNKNEVGTTTQPADATVKIDNKIELRANATLIFEGETIQAQSFDVAGQLVQNHAQVKVDSSVHIARNANVTTKDSQITGNSITHEGTINYQGYFGLKASADIATTKSSHIQTDQHDAKSILQLEADSANLNGKVKAENAIVDVVHLSNAHTLVSRTGKYTDFYVSNAFGLHTDDDIRLEQPIQRNCGLSITARSVYMGTDYHTSHDVVLKSTAGDVSLYSNLQANNIFVDSARHLYTARNVHGQQIVQFTAAQDYINLGGHVQGDDVVSCKAATIKNYYFQSHELDQLPTSLKKWMGHDGSIQGRQVFLEATQGNIENHGGVIRGTEYLQAIATQGSIINQYSVQQQHGKYDTIKTFTPAIMAGGSGLDDQHIGLYLSANGKVINNGSTLYSEANNYIQANQGFECVGQSHTYTSYHKEKSKWYGSKKEKTETSTNVQTAEVIAKNGRNTIICENGGIYGVAAQFISRDGTQAYAQGDIKLYSLKYEDQSVTKKQQLWGAHKSKKKENHEHAVATLIYDHGISKLESAQGNIVGRGVVALGNGAFITIAKNGSILFSADKLSHSVHQKSSGLSISCPTLQQINGLLDSQNLLSNFDPMIGKVNTLLHSEQASEWGANSWNAAVSGYNNYQMLQDAWNQDGAINQLLLQRSGLNGMMTPTINLTYGSTVQNSDWETVGPGSIQRSSWHIEAADRVLIEGMTVDIAGDMRVKAKTLGMHGHALHSKTTMSQQLATVGIGMTGVESASASYAKSKTTSTQHANQQTRVGGNFHVDVEDWNLKSANVDAGTLTGNVAHVLHLQSQQDHSRTKTEQVSLSTTGQVGLAQSRDEVARVQHATGIHVREGINQDAVNQFNVNTTINEGAKITSDGQNNFRSETIINKEVKDYQKHRSHGITFNAHEVAKLIQSTPESEQPNARAVKVVGVATVTQTKQDFSAVQQATYHGAGGTHINAAQIIGNMNTQNNNGYTVLKDSKQNVSVDVPLVDLRQMSSHKTQPKPVAETVTQIVVTQTSPVNEVTTPLTATANPVETTDAMPVLVDNESWWTTENATLVQTKKQYGEALENDIKPVYELEQNFKTQNPGAYYFLNQGSDDAVSVLYGQGQLIHKNFPLTPTDAVVSSVALAAATVCSLGAPDNVDLDPIETAVVFKKMGQAIFELGVKAQQTAQQAEQFEKECNRAFAADVDRWLHSDNSTLRQLKQNQQQALTDIKPLADADKAFKVKHPFLNLFANPEGCSTTEDLYDNMRTSQQHFPTRPVDVVGETTSNVIMNMISPDYMRQQAYKPQAVLNSDQLSTPTFKWSDAMRLSFFAPPLRELVPSPNVTANVNTNLIPQPNK